MVLFLPLTLLPLAGVVLGDPDPVRVYLLGGQSNMKGFGTDITAVGAPWDQPQDDVRIWRFFTGTWVDLQDGFGETFGPELSFGRAVADRYPDEPVYLIKHAANGTSLHNDWAPFTGYQWATFQSIVAQALLELELAGVDYEIAGMLWMQGESDAFEGMGAAYEANLRELIEAVRGMSGDPELPFVLGRIAGFFGDAANNTAVREAQVAVAESTPNVEWFDTDDLPLVLFGHYDSPGQITLGERFATGLFATRVWNDLGLALPGANGEPVLTGEGPLYVGEGFQMKLEAAAPGAPVFLALGGTAAFLPLFGGTLVPDVTAPSGAILTGATDASGQAEWSLAWPAVPSGTQLYWQAWALDAGAPGGVAASNGLLSTSP